MDITPAAPEDIPQLCDLLTILFSQEAEFQPDPAAQTEGLRQIVDFPDRGHILVLRDGETVAGMISLLWNISTALGGRVATVEDFVVRPEYRHGGGGTHLLKAAINYAAQAGCRRITLLTDHDNERAQRLYARHGFQPSEMLTMRMKL